MSEQDRGVIDQSQDQELFRGHALEGGQLVEVIFEAYAQVDALLNTLRSRLGLPGITNEERAEGEAIIGRIEQLKTDLGIKAGESDEYTNADIDEITARGSEIVSILQSIKDYLIK